MSDARLSNAAKPTTEELLGAIEATFRRSIRQLERRPSAYRSSYPLEEMRVEMDDGSIKEVIFKDLGDQGLTEAVRKTKPAFLHDPHREICVYQHILGNTRSEFGTADFLGAIANDATGRYWLFLEKVVGQELYQVGDFSIWQEAARWLARWHTRHAVHPRSLLRSIPLICCDAEYYALWPQRAQEFARPTDDHRWQRLQRVVNSYEVVVQRLANMPVTLLHGEFYASNILVQQGGAALRICPIDWEMAAIGTDLLDLASLIAGKWTEDEKAALALAYYAALPPQCRSREEDFLDSLNYCRLHLAVQWLGWSPNWSPPIEHSYDWLSELLILAEKLALL